MNMKSDVIAIITLTVLLGSLLKVNSQPEMMSSQLQVPVAQFRADILEMKSLGKVDGAKLITDVEAIISAAKTVEKFPAEAVNHMNDLVNKIRTLTADGSAKPEQIVEAIKETKLLVLQSIKKALSA